MLDHIAPFAESNFEVAVGDDLVTKVIEISTPFVGGHCFYKKNNILLFKRTKATHCQLCNRMHHNNNTAYVAVHQTMVVLHCHRSPEHIIIGRLGGDPKGLGCEMDLMMSSFPEALAPVAADAAQPKSPGSRREPAWSSKQLHQRPLSIVPLKRGQWKLSTLTRPIETQRLLL